MSINILYNIKFKNYIFFLLIMNAIIISNEGIIGDKIIKIINLIFSLLFFLEDIIKLSAFGIQSSILKRNYKKIIIFYFLGFSKGISNIYDLALNFYIFLDFFLWVNYTKYKNFTYYRFLNITIVFRTIRLLKYFQFLKIIKKVLKETFSSFISIAFMLLLVLTCYATIGKHEKKNYQLYISIN